MEYRIVRTGENKDYLEHAIHGMGKRTYSGTSQKSNGSGGGSDSGGTGQGRGRQKGFQLDNHLYLARQWVGDKWRYAYNQAEVKAMQNWGKAKKAAGDVADAAKGAAGTARKILSGDYAKGVDSKVDKYQSRVDTNTKRASDASSKTESTREKIKSAREYNDAALSKMKEIASEKTGLSISKAIDKDRRFKNVDNSRKRNSDDINNYERELSKHSNAEDTYNKASKAAQQELNKAKNEQSSAAYKISKASGAVRDYVNDTTDKAKKVIENERISPTSTTNRARNAVSNIGYEAARGVKNAGKAVSDYASDKANKAKNVYEKAKSDVGDYVSDKASKASKMAKEAGDILSGKKARDIDSKVSHYRESANAAEERRNEQGQNKDYDAAYRTEKIRKNLDERATKYEDQQKGAGYRISKAVNDARDAARDIGSKASKAASDASDLMNKTLSSVNDRVSEGKRKALAILDKASESGRSLKDTTMKAAQDAAERGKERLDKFLEVSADTASKTYGKAKTKVEVARNPENETNIKEQNLYKYDKSYREASDRASYLGSYLDNWDKNGGPKTAEGRANYQRMLRELNALEAQLNAKRK